MNQRQSYQATVSPITIRDLSVIECSSAKAVRNRSISEVVGGERPDGGAANQGPRDAEAVIRPRRSNCGARTDAKGGKLPDGSAAWQPQRTRQSGH